jgi:flagellar export protein FliJ
MKAFHFPLGRVLDWRRREAEVEKMKLRELLRVLHQLEAARRELQRSREEARREVAAAEGCDAAQLWTLAAYLRRSESEEAALAERIETSLVQVTAQQQRHTEAERRCKLLEKLKHSSHSAWQAEFGRELEAFAGEAFLAQWSKQLR